jgi:hypothetical protein
VTVANPSIIEQRVSRSSSFSRPRSIWSKISGTTTCVAEIRKFNFYLQNFIATWRSDSIYYLQKLILVLLNTLQNDFKELGEDE